jgi:predicted phosphate transport protein (TIGR00153 family)
MNINKILTFLVPKNSKFFTLFHESSNNLVDASDLLIKIFSKQSFDERLEFASQMHALETKGDEITHNIFSDLSSNFITPFDREDIHELASSLDTIIDTMDGTAKRVKLYQMDVVNEQMVQLAALVKSAVLEIAAALHGLENVKDPGRVREAIGRIDEIEKHADNIHNEAIAELFRNEKDAIQLIKKKEILQNLEKAVDFCLDSANVIESILIKNS